MTIAMSVNEGVNLHGAATKKKGKRVLGCIGNYDVRPIDSKTPCRIREVAFLSILRTRGLCLVPEDEVTISRVHLHEWAVGGAGKSLLGTPRRPISERFK